MVENDKIFLEFPFPFNETFLNSQYSNKTKNLHKKIYAKDFLIKTNQDIMVKVLNLA
jgi:hypothetical protein